MSTIAIIEPEVGKIQWWFRVTRRYNVVDPIGWRVLDVAIIKLIEIPEAGGPIQKKHYKGIWFRILFWMPFDSIHHP